MSSSVDQIKSKIDIVSLISSYMKLEKVGANWKGRCPFHNEKTPSFFVSPDRGSFYCFGCQAKGDIFTFVENFEGLDFLGALKVLAEKAGVELHRFEKEEKSDRGVLFTVLEQATLFFQGNLEENSEALQYLKNRGLSRETIKDFRVGYAKDEWRSLYDHLISKGVPEKDMFSAGLIKQKEGNDKRHYDTFRGRIIFPISDSGGRVVGFSGRTLVNSENSPKYLNSPDTKLFNKSEILFGFDKAKKEIRLKDFSILVEGQMDLVMLHDKGYKNSVASSGTALSQEHLNKLRRLSQRIVLAYDGDRAGFLASERSAKLALSLGMELKVAEFPKSKDPADIAKENPVKLKEIIAGSKHIIDYLVDNILNQGHSGRDLSELIYKNVLPFIKELPSNIERSHFVNSIARKTFIKEDAIWADLQKITLGKESVIEKNQSPPKLSVRSESIERKIFGLLIWIEENKSSDKSNAEEHNIKVTRDKIKDITGGKFDKLKEKFEKEKSLLLFETDAYYNGRPDLNRELEDLTVSLEEEYLKKDFEKAMIMLQTSEQSRDSKNVLKYLEECQKISQRINSIKTIRNAYQSH